VGGHDWRQVCPNQTTNYSLRIVNRNGSQENYGLTVQVGSPVQINFWADAVSVPRGQCTTLHWDVEGVQAVYVNVGYGDEGVVGHGTRQVCPTGLTDYILKIIHRDGRQEIRSVQVNVLLG
jgi:hypothetical protein